ncbi:hypothetical protein V8C86DRAFT_3168736 [Haematococcus lacustris]
MPRQQDEHSGWLEGSRGLAASLAARCALQLAAAAAAAAWTLDRVAVSYMFAGSAADITALDSLCQTRLRSHSSSAFWQQLVQFMPAVQQVSFWTVAGAATWPMCESLRLMAVLPWARWLDIKASAAGRPLPACCLDMFKVFNNPSQPGRISVWCLCLVLSANGSTYIPALALSMLAVLKHGRRYQRKAAANKLVMSPDGGRQALPDDVARRAIQLGAGGALSLTCRAFSKTNLLHAPALRIQLDSQRCDQFLSARIVAALNARTCKLALTLEEQQAQNGRQYIRLLTRVLRRLPSCAAVEACRLGSIICTQGRFRAQAKGNTELSGGGEGDVDLEKRSGVWSRLSLQLQQLDLSSTTIQPKRPEPGAATLATLFHASRLKQLSLLINNTAGGGNNLLLHNLQPLSQHLTQLCLVHQGYVECLNKFIAALQPLAQLQVLTISGLWYLGGLPGLLQALPQLHTLQLPDAVVKGQEQLDTLLAATQLTSIQLHSLERLTISCADVPCSWQRLELTDSVDCATAAHLPLHSLTQPLVLGALSIRIDEGDNCALAAAAVQNLTQACKVPVKIEDLWLYMSEAAMAAELQVELQPLVAVLQALKHCSWGRVYLAHMNVGAADVLTLAPLCQACTELEFAYGSLTPSLDFWRQLLQLLPTVTHLTFSNSRGSDSAAMCKSLERMAEQPWARWLDICILRPSHSDGLPAWVASPLTQPDKLSVWFNTMIQ